ncbi:ATPase family AAA domain-containing protein 2-like isoform X2 [Tribolium madens]|uniref:ATPase family AAA domain-containing protein 2-like isoform X2 n=1 Tax=Tribolium madens TaxID=41895 RepID=UPI001CF74921|nr:ATPase family AAA domain-containing protein 2-like isoform X2 [Tribolium madens]
MVNTRRTESIGSTPDFNTQHRPGKTAAEDSDSSSVSESEDSQSEDASWESQGKRKTHSKKDPALGLGVRELRSRFVYSERKYSSSLRSENLNTRKRIALDERHSLTVYSSRNMHNDSDMYNGNDSDDDMYSRKRRRSRHLRSHLDRIERRTALSLRPISQKCYADSLSDTELRRSKRQRKNMSWLADDQMHKMGYPNLNTPGYSEEDSRDAPDVRIEEPSRSTRHSSDVNSSKRREIKSPKYLFNYETNEVPPRRRRSELTLRSSERNQKELRSRRESNDKENNEETSINGRSSHNRSSKRTNEVVEEDSEKKSDDTVEDDSNDSAKVQENGVETNQEAAKVGTNNEENKSSESDIPKMRTKPKPSNTIIINRNFSRRPKNRKRFDSSSSESEGAKKGYSLRTRQPKPPPMKHSTLHSHELPRNRKRFTRRRKVSSSSSSSSSDADMRHSKTPKNQHSKSEQKMKSGAGGSKIIPIGPETLDTKVRFSCIGGLDGHIQCLKEMILLPMMYPEVFRQFQIQPPRGVLFHGPPGTGKTLIARALANECSFGCRKVSFFMRKGADLLSKWIGESEKQLRLLFEQAAELHPSIIFFDELDGLAPVRSSRQDQVHASIVSTLLALMDGLDNRGEVIVIGATNRIDAIDPALRRPGRFDRELFFPLPAKQERESILKVHVSQWSSPPSEELLSYLAETAVGYCGSDLRALCSEAVIQGFRRTYPQVYNADYRLMLNPENVKVEKIDFLRAKSLLVPASHRVTQGLGRKLLLILEPLLSEAVKNVFKMLEQTFPHALNPALSKVKLSPNLRPAQLLLLGETPDCGQTSHLAPAILYKMEHIHAYILDLATLYKETGRSAEETCIQVFNEARRNVPSVIYIPNIDNWWVLVSETVKAILDSQLSQMDPNIPILLLATAESTYDNLPDEIQNIFSRYRKEVYQLDLPNDASREAFFKPLLIDLCLKPHRPPRKRPKTPPPLPRARTPPPTPLTEEQSKKLYEQEEHTLRELRIFLRDICKKLANNKLFFMFTKPVDTEEVPDYPTIIKQPMDLETMMTKVDFHRYECAKDFLKDIELIVQNALEYNPAKTSADKQIRHRACSLRDYAYTLIKNEMDSDFEDKCQDIALKRQVRKASVQKYLPAYIQTPDDLNLVAKAEEPAEKKTEEAEENNPPSQDVKVSEKPKTEEKNESTSSTIKLSTTKKRRSQNTWQRGYVKKRKRTSKTSEGLQQEGDKKDSSDDSKDVTVTSEPDDASAETVNVEHTAPLTINCNELSQKGNAELQSPRRRLSDLMSPSELLENPLEFDDIDQALNENVEEPVNMPPVECLQKDLEKILEQTVQITSGCSLQPLLDLYNQLSRIVKKFSNTHLRTDLPKELGVELNRFKNEASLESVSERSPSSNQST